MTTAINQLDSMKAAGLTESVIYRPGAGRARVIDVVVDRAGRQVEGHAARPEMTVAAVNDQIKGIDPTLIDEGADHIDVAEDFGGTPETLQLGRIVEQDHEWVTVEVA